jgi:hypothetical protein
MDEPSSFLDRSSTDVSLTMLDSVDLGVWLRAVAEQIPSIHKVRNGRGDHS